MTVAELLSELSNYYHGIKGIVLHLPTMPRDPQETAASRKQCLELYQICMVDCRLYFHIVFQLVAQGNLRKNDQIINHPYLRSLGDDLTRLFEIIQHFPVDKVTNPLIPALTDWGWGNPQLNDMAKKTLHRVSHVAFMLMDGAMIRAINTVSKAMFKDRPKANEDIIVRGVASATVLTPCLFVAHANRLPEFKMRKHSSTLIAKVNTLCSNAQVLTVAQHLRRLAEYATGCYHYRNTKADLSKEEQDILQTFINDIEVHYSLLMYFITHQHIRMEQSLEDWFFYENTKVLIQEVTDANLPSMAFQDPYHVFQAKSDKPTLLGGFLTAADIAASGDEEATLYAIQKNTTASEQCKLIAQAARDIQSTLSMRGVSIKRSGMSNVN